jgi:pimeloyl-ACP methyl ester carboxylesterase
VNLHADPPSAGLPDLLTVDTADGVRLAASRYGEPTSEVAVIFGHGFTGHQFNPRITRLARTLARSGLAVYTFDFRGHGRSGGRSTFGDREVFDLEAVVQRAQAQHLTIVTSGASMGAFVALRHAGLGGQVDAVVAISSPAYAEPSPLLRARMLGHLVRSDSGRRLLHLYGTRTEPFAPVASAPVDLAAGIAPVPVALLHGTQDPYVPLSDAVALYEHLNDPRRLVVLRRFGHAEASFRAGFAQEFEAVLADVLRYAPTEPLRRGLGRAG